MDGQTDGRAESRGCCCSDPRWARSLTPWFPSASHGDCHSASIWRTARARLPVSEHGDGWWPQTCCPSSRLYCLRKTRRIFPYLAPLFSFLVAVMKMRVPARPMCLLPDKPSVTGAARGFPALISETLAGASHTPRGPRMRAGGHNPGTRSNPRAGHLRGRSPPATAAELRRPTSVPAPEAIGGWAAGPWPACPPWGPQEEVDFPICSPQPIIALFQIKVPTSASDWWSLSHMPALRRKGSWESELWLLCQGGRSRREGNFPHLGRESPSLGRTPGR